MYSRRGVLVNFLLCLNDAVGLRRTGAIVEVMCAGGEDDEAPELPARRVVAGRKRGKKSVQDVRLFLAQELNTLHCTSEATCSGHQRGNSGLAYFDLRPTFRLHTP